MGGALSIASAVLIPEVDAVVSFYGVPSPELADPAHAKAPVQAHFGELDSFVGFSDLTVEPLIFHFLSSMSSLKKYLHHMLRHCKCSMHNVVDCYSLVTKCEISHRSERGTNQSLQGCENLSLVDAF